MSKSEAGEPNEHVHEGSISCPGCGDVVVVVAHADVQAIRVTPMDARAIASSAARMRCLSCGQAISIVTEE